MKKITLFFVLFSSFSFGLNEYYGLSRSMRAQGMGGAYYALSDDEYAMFYNPAGLSLYQQEWQLGLPIQVTLGTNAITKFSQLQSAFENSSNISQVVSNLDSLRGSPFSAGVGLTPFYVQKNFAVGLLIADTKVNFSLVGAGVDTEVRMAALSDSGLFISYAREVYPNLHVGATFKAIGRVGGKKTYTTLDIAQNSSFSTNLESLGGFGAGIDADVGAIYEFQEGILPYTIGHRVSLTFTNLLATNFTIAERGDSPQLPRYMSVGTVTYLKKMGPLGNIKFLLDLAEFQIGGQSDPEFGARTGSIWKHVNWGVEVPFGRTFAIRSGFHQGNFSAGLGVNLKYFKFDFLYTGIERGTSIATNTEHRLGFRMAFGLGALYPRAIDADSFKEHNQDRMEIFKAEKVVEESPENLGGDTKGGATDLGKELEKGTGQEVNTPEAKTDAESAAQEKAAEAEQQQAEDLSNPN